MKASLRRCLRRSIVATVAVLIAAPGYSAAAATDNVPKIRAWSWPDKKCQFPGVQVNPIDLKNSVTAVYKQYFFPVQVEAHGRTQNAWWGAACVHVLHHVMAAGQISKELPSRGE